MQSRRTFLTIVARTGVLVAVGTPLYALSEEPVVKIATAITQVFGKGVKLVAVAVEYATPVSASGLTSTSFRVEGRTVTGAFVSTSTNPTDRADIGHFVIVTLSPDDANAPLAEKLQPQDGKTESPKGPGGPGRAGDIPTYDTIYKSAEATVVQAENISAEDGTTIAASDTHLTTTTIENLIVDAFQQFVFADPKTSRSLHYNLYVPKDYDPAKSYPLVLFMHDAGATSDTEGSPINYVAFRQGTVIPKGQSAAGASGHRNTWRIAYAIAPIREWIFRQ